MLVFLSQLAIEAGLDLGFRAAEAPRCPACRERLPVVRPPRTWRQLWHGGRDCPSCGRFYRTPGGTPVSFDAPPSSPSPTAGPG